MLKIEEEREKKLPSDSTANPKETFYCTAFHMLTTAL